MPYLSANWAVVTLVVMSPVSQASVSVAAVTGGVASVADSIRTTP